MNSFKASIAATVLVASAVNLHAQSVLTPSSTGNKVHLNFNNQAASDAIDSLSHQMRVVRDSLTQLAITQAYQQVSLSSASLQITGASLMDSLRVMNFTDLDGDLDVGGDVHITGTVTGITAAMVGLGNADNTADADKPVSTATQTALDLKAPLESPAFTGTVTGITAAMVGLGNADNTADADKPVSTATQTALDLKAPLESPAFTGSPSLPTGATAITQPEFDNSTKLATTAYTDAAVQGLGGATLQMLNAFASGFEHLIDSLSCTWTKHQGHVYELVLIGNQCWFAENLQATHYANGVEIQEITDGAAWSVATEGARVAYDNDPTNVATYGYLYNWFAVDSAAGLCPSGWHVPSTDEWNTLTDYIGGLSTAGVKLKSAPPSWDGIDSVGFSGLPGGYRNPYNFGSFAGKSERGDWWSATESGEMTAWHRQMALNNLYVGRFSFFTKQFAFSVRCLRD